jgi:hypothetical protein
MMFTESTPTDLPLAPQSIPVVVLGSDALLAAAPATPVQLAHACLLAGFATVIPASWGDELIATRVLRELPAFGTGPAIQCSCPIVAHRLLTVGGDLRPALLALVPPPVAVARYLKSISGGTPTRITYVGACPGAIDASIDIRMTPDALIAMLGERGISLDEQPRMFDSIIPPDRRRFYSQPGGIPSAESLWNEVIPRSIIELNGEELAADLAQHLLSGKSILIDASTRLGCVCSGAVPGTAPSEARTRIVALEPPRSGTPVVTASESIVLALPVPAASRTPVDVLAVPHIATPCGPMTNLPTPAPQRAPRPSPLSSRAVFGTVPVARNAEGRSLPRAFVARRRSPPRSMRAIGEPDSHPPLDDRTETSNAVLTPPHSIHAIRDEADERAAIATASNGTTIPARPRSLFAAPGEDPMALPRAAAPAARFPSPAHPQAPRRPALGSMSRRQAITALVAVLAVALSVGAVVAIFVARSLRDPAPTKTPGSPGTPH